MEYRKLGRTDLSVSAICLGTMTWGQQNTEAEGHAQIDRAVGATSMEQLDADLAAADLVWTPELKKAVDAVHQWRGNPCP